MRMLAVIGLALALGSCGSPAAPDGPTASVREAVVVRVCSDGTAIGRDRQGRYVVYKGGRNGYAGYLAPEVRPEQACGQEWRR